MSKRQRRQSSRSAAPPPFISGWAPQHPKSSHLHAIPYPGDLQTDIPALCGVKPVTVWLDPEVEELWRCHTCLVEFGKLIDNNDERLTPWDKRTWIDIYNKMTT